MAEQFSDVKLCDADCQKLRRAIRKADAALAAAVKLKACGVDCRAEEALATAIRERASALLGHFGSAGG